MNGEFAYAAPLAAVTGAHEWNRTIDLFLTKEVLYRLSYVSVKREISNYSGAGEGNRTLVISLEN